MPRNSRELTLPRVKEVTSIVLGTQLHRFSLPHLLQDTSQRPLGREVHLANPEYYCPNRRWVTAWDLRVLELLSLG